MHIPHNIRKGFIAVTLVLTVVFFVLAYAYVVMGGVLLYADSVNRHEWRIQADMNAESCLSTVALMAVKDYFLEGNISVPEFGCQAIVSRDHAHRYAHIQAQTIFLGVTSLIYNEDVTIP